MSTPLHLAVVGHTNTGKTSLLRTLTRDTDFGEVSARPSTTRHVEGARLLVEGEPVVELYDTPGMEDAMGLLEAVESLVQPGERLDGPDRIERFLHSPLATERFEQEAKVLRQLLASDAALVVIDARDPVLAKHRDELALLAACARPLLPVLNFVHSPASREAEWREALARLGLHAVVSFDTVAPEVDGERRLLEKLITLLDAHRLPLERLLQARAQEARERMAAGQRLIAELLIDVAACRVMVKHDEEEAIQRRVELLRERIRQREQACVAALLTLYRFRPGDVDMAALPLVEGRWEEDLFSPDALRGMGIRLGKGAVAGAITGVGIDLVAGGLTLGAATVVGAVAGGLWQVLGHYGEHLVGKLRGFRSLTVDDAILRLLAVRQRWLLAALHRRGHAAIEPLRLEAPDVKRWRKGALPEAIKSARQHPEWSALNEGFKPEAAREKAIAELAEQLVDDPSTR
jgi:hypothetical protein